jgi:hypothetical protein
MVGQGKSYPTNFELECAYYSEVKDESQWVKGAKRSRHDEYSCVRKDFIMKYNFTT